MTQAEIIKQGAKIELARRNFFDYCNLKAPDFYKKDRKFLVDFCSQLQAFYFSDDDIFVVNMPPRHGKSRTVGCFVEWVLGKNHKEKIMTGSYNEKI
ncbi:MAG: terminase, partial [Ruminococcus sp.]